MATAVDPVPFCVRAAGLTALFGARVGRALARNRLTATDVATLTDLELGSLSQIGPVALRIIRRVVPYGGSRYCPTCGARVWGLRDTEPASNDGHGG